MQADSSFTSLVLKRVPPRCTSAVLVEMLDKIAEGQYDFVHLPYDIRNHKNLSLAFVNFLDHTTAASALRWLSTATNCPQGLAPSTQVHWGQIHGLGPNLAHFIARFGIAALDPPYAPFVFLNGISVSRPRQIVGKLGCNPSGVLVELKPWISIAREPEKQTPTLGLLPRDCYRFDWDDLARIG